MRVAAAAAVQKFDLPFDFLLVAEVKMNYYTSRYNIQTSLAGFSGVKLNYDEGRWICCQFKESLGRHGFSYLLIDNYGASHTLLVKRNEAGELEVQSDTLRILSSQGAIDVYTPVHSIMQYPFPDFLIDVLGTISAPVAIEALCRVAERFAKMTTDSRR